MILGCLAATSGLLAQDKAPEPTPLEQAQALFLQGKHEESLDVLDSSWPERSEYSDYGVWEVRNLVETGRYEDAVAKGASRLGRRSLSPPLVLELVKALRALGQSDDANTLMFEVLRSDPDAPKAGDSADTVAFAEILLLQNADAKRVLDRLLKPAKKADPEAPHAYLAIGRLALATHDRALAAENFREGFKRFPKDPRFALGLFESGLDLPVTEQREGVTSYLDVALNLKPRYPDALLAKATVETGRKDFAAARETLANLITINPQHAEAWATLAAIELLNEDQLAADAALTSATLFHRDNPRVPFVVGKTLASQYWFAEGITYLEKAHALDPQSAEIQFELGSNQLRFGQLEEGWRNVEAAHEGDPYHVGAFNLIVLRDKIASYPVLEEDDVMVRMSPEDMAVFGKRALDLAVRAKRTLAEKYDFTLEQPVLVEMLPKQEDFAIRTFGLPGGESFLGVCFGPLITMTSPRGRLGRANWEAVLWHEMAHTITLGASRHRIPRWLSEGISVYEEREVSTGWGMGMNSVYRERILTDEVPGILSLNESFAGPDIMFGYYYASLVVEYLVEEFGIDAMKGILADLSAGKSLEVALALHTRPVGELEKVFREHTRELAAGYGPEMNWEPLSDEEYITYREDPAAWVSQNPKRYAAAMMWTTRLVEEEHWQEARPILERIIALEPDNREGSGPYSLLAATCRGLGDDEAEAAALKKLVALDENDAAAAARLFQLDANAQTADRVLTTNPFMEAAYRTIMNESLANENVPRAKEACLSLLALEPRDASRLHYQLARILLPDDPEQARRQVLKALEENPRFQLALELLVELPATSP